MYGQADVLGCNEMLRAYKMNVVFNLGRERGHPMIAPPMLIQFPL